MQQLKHKIPSTGSLEAQAVSLGKEPESADEPRRFEMEAYTGAIFDIGFGPAVVDIATLKIPPGGIPTLRQHNWELFIGRSDEIDKGPPLLINGTLFQGVDEADEVARISDQGGRWQASIGFGFSMAERDISFIGEGETQHVNGKLLSGPFLLLKNATLKENSFVPLGADSNTSAVALGDSGIQLDEHREVTMSNPNGPSYEDEQKRVADISSAFSDDPTFALTAINKNLSLTDAKLEWAEKLNAKLAEQTTAHKAKLAELEASHAAALEEAKKKPAAKPASPAAALSDFTPGEPGGESYADQFELAVAAECKVLRDLGSNGMQRGGGLRLNRAANIRALAVQRVVSKNPELHSAYLEAHNANVAALAAQRRRRK